MTVYELDPLVDPRWPEFLSGHFQASIFHSRQWLQALRQTYGYRPVVFTTSNGKELANGVVFCKIQSWVTGRRLVSLPFSDHCQPLANNNELRAILAYLKGRRKKERLRYIELRPLPETDGFDQITEFSNSEKLSFQRIDLRPEVDDIYRNFHDSCIRRKIKRAARENLEYSSGRSDDLLEKFRYLLLLTRRRHKLPPQPASWFRNLAQCLGDKITFHLLSKDSAPVASIVTLTYRRSIIYKYGCSDAQFHNLGGTPFLFWKVIQQAKAEGLEEFDLGRSDYEDPGLIAFKEHLGAVSSELRYYRNPAPHPKTESAGSENSFARQALARLPDPLLVGAGELTFSLQSSALSQVSPVTLNSGPTLFVTALQTRAKMERRTAPFMMFSTR
jgi:lipid II:glycine glycyltransferase (peptidoglycan interpeptide bridge formation enzyme)